VGQEALGLAREIDDRRAEAETIKTLGSVRLRLAYHHEAIVASRYVAS
jgi:hypothetical protein